MTPVIKFYVDPNGLVQLYAKFRKATIYETVEIKSGVMVDVDENGELVGIEVVRKLEPARPVVIHEIQRSVERRFERSYFDEFSSLKSTFEAIKA